MIVVYVAGPYRAKNNWVIEQNVRRAETVALNVWAMGLVAICPHAMSRFYQGALPDATWLAGDLEILKRCDAVLLISGWQTSEGTRAEIAQAHRCLIPTFETLEELREWAVRHARQHGDQLLGGGHGGAGTAPAVPDGGVG
jgi:hypothetical protein